jgi:hypothetical protein
MAAAPARPAPVDQHVDVGERARRERDAELASCRAIDDELERRRQLDGEVAGLRPYCISGL